MFFDMDLLCRQRNGKFALVWLAATRGISEAKKYKLKNVKIVFICEEILQYVMSNTTVPRDRFSLYLSAKLMYGTVLIHRYQVDTLEREIKFFSLSVRRPAYRFENDADENAVKEKRKNTKKVVKDKKPSKKPEKDVVEELLVIEEQMLRTFPEGSINVTDMVNITLRDEISTRININEPELFGDEGQLDQQLAKLDDLTTPHFLPPDVQPVTIPGPSNAEKTPSKRRVIGVEDVEQSPSKRLRREKIAHMTSPNVRVQVHGVLSPASPHRAIMPPPPSPSALMPPPPVPSSPRRPPLPGAATTLTGEEIRANLATPVTPAPPRPRGVRRRLSMEFDVLTPSRWKQQNVHREQDASQPGRRSLKKPESPGVAKDSVDIIAEMLSGFRCSEEDFISVFNDVQGRFSIPRLRTREQPPEADVAPVVQAEPTAHVEVSVRETRAQTPAQQPQEVPMMPSPRLSRIPLEFEPVDKSVEKSGEEKQLPRITETEAPIPRVHTSTPISKLDTEAKRHKEVLKQIRELLSNPQCESLKLEQLLCLPYTKLKVARTFQALLHLQSQGYIRMTSYDNSLELDQIFPGPKLYS